MDTEKIPDYGMDRAYHRVMTELNTCKYSEDGRGCIDMCCACCIIPDDQKHEFARDAAIKHIDERFGNMEGDG